MFSHHEILLVRSPFTKKFAQEKFAINISSVKKICQPFTKPLLFLYNIIFSKITSKLSSQEPRFFSISRRSADLGKNESFEQKPVSSLPLLDRRSQLLIYPRSRRLFNLPLLFSPLPVYFLHSLRHLIREKQSYTRVFAIERRQVRDYGDFRRLHHAYLLSIELRIFEVKTPFLRFCNSRVALIASSRGQCRVRVSRNNHNLHAHTGRLCHRLDEKELVGQCYLCASCHLFEDFILSFRQVCLRRFNPLRDENITQK